MAQSLAGLAKKHDAETREQQIVVCRKFCLGRIGFAKDEVRAIRQRSAGACNIEHRGRYVDTEDRTRLAHDSRNFDRSVATPAADVDYPLARLRRRNLQRGITERHDDAVELSLHRDPSLAHGAVPFRNLF